MNAVARWQDSKFLGEFK